MNGNEHSYLNEIVKALQNLGGTASLSEIQTDIENRNTMPYIHTNVNWRDNIRATIQRHCSATKSYRGATDIFYPVYGLGEGFWGLNSYKNTISLTELNPIEQRLIESVENDAALSDTEKKQIILARRGQGVFRERLIEKYKVCIVTGIEDHRLVTASHIKPWWNATGKERLSVNNGLLLSMLYDKLFDKGLITFKTNGHIAISPKLSEHDKSIIGIDITCKYLSNIPAELKCNIEYHNDCIFLK